MGSDILQYLPDPEIVTTSFNNHLSLNASENLSVSVNYSESKKTLFGNERFPKLK